VAARELTCAVTPSTVDTLALWDPTRNSMRVVGPDVFVLGAYTPPGAEHSLLAWVDGRPAGTASYRLAITDTATLRTRLLSSPLQSSAAEFGRNYVGGGGFSPDGRYLAAFVTSFRPGSWPDAQLVLIGIGNDAIDPIANTTVHIGEPQGWVTWSPSGNQLFGGSYREGSVIQAFRLRIGQKRAVPLSLDLNADNDITDSAVAFQRVAVSPSRRFSAGPGGPSRAQPPRPRSGRPRRGRRRAGRPPSRGPLSPGPATS
jgi:hypothetical protein